MSIGLNELNPAVNLSVPGQSQTLSSGHQRWYLSPGWITCVAGLIRIGFIALFVLPTGRPSSASPALGFEALNIARSIATHQGFSSPFLSLSGPTGPTAWLTPVFPYILALPIALFGVGTSSCWIAILLLNEAFSTLTCWPVFRAARELAGTRCGALAAWMWAIFPVAVWAPCVAIWYTSLSALLAAWLLDATLRVRESRRFGAWLVYGVGWGAEVLTNASFASILPFTILWLARDLYRARRPWVRFPLIASFAVILAVAPWTVRNYQVFHALVPLRSNFGLELWRFNNAGLPLHPVSSPAELKKYVQLGELAYMKEKKQEAFRFIRSHFHKFLLGVRWRFIFFWIVGLHGNPLSFSLSNLALTALVPVGMAFLYLRRRNEFALFLLFPLIFPVVYYVTLSSILYRHAIDPVLIVIAAFGVFSIYTWFADRFRSDSDPLYARQRAEVLSGRELQSRL